MIDAPAASSSWGVTPLTAPRVPTGMKAGVSTTPWGVVSRPRRAWASAARRSKVRGMPLSGLALRVLLPAHVDHPVRYARRQLQGEPVVRQGDVAPDVAELVFDAVAAGLDVLEALGEEGLAVDPQGHRLEALGDARRLRVELHAVGVPLRFGELEPHGEVLEQGVQAAARPQVLEDLARVAPDLEGLGALQVAVPGGHLVAADDDGDRAGRGVLPAYLVGGSVGEGPLGRLGGRQHRALLLLGEAGLQGLELLLLEADAVDQGGEPLRPGQPRGQGIGRRLVPAGGERRDGEEEREEGDAEL